MQINLRAFLFLFFVIFSISSKAQVNIKKKHSESINYFINGYNEQSYSIFKKSLGFVAKTLVNENIIIGQALGPQYKIFGKIIRLGDASYLSYKTIIIPIYYEKDSLSEYYLKLTFTKGNKITLFQFKDDNIVYHKLNQYSTIDSIVKPYVDYPSNDNSSLAIGVIEKGEKKIYTFGGKNVNNKKLPTDSTLFQIGSITKPFTGLLFANLINNNLVDSLSTINSFLPDSIQTIKFQTQEIRLIHLATHASGLPREPSNLESTIKDIQNPFSNYYDKDLMNYLDHFKLNRPVGKQYEYSNTGMGLLGYILSKKMKQPYEELLISKICNPLGLNDTRTSLDEDQKNRKAISYYMGKEVPDFTFNSPFIGAGGIYSTTKDMLKFIEANLYPQNCEIGQDLSLAQKIRKADKHHFMGFAWEISKIDTDEGAISVIGHSGNTLGSSSVLLFSVEKELGIIVLSNSNIPVDKLGELLFQFILINHL